MLVMKRGRNPAPKAPGFGCSGHGAVSGEQGGSERCRGRMWLEGKVHEQDGKMLQNNDKEEEKGRGLCLGWWEVVLWLC